MRYETCGGLAEPFDDGEQQPRAKSRAPSPAIERKPRPPNVASSARKPSGTIEAGEDHGGNIADRPRETYPVKILRQQRHHAPLDHGGEQHDLPQSQPDAHRQPCELGVRAPPAIAACAKRSACSRAQFDAELRDLRRMHAIAGHVAEMPQSLSVRARSCAPSRAPQGPRSRLPQRMKARSSNPRATQVSTEQNCQRRERDRVEQFDPAKERPRAQIKRRHQRGAKDRRTILHDANVGREREDREQARGKDGEAQLAAHPQEEHDQRAHMQAGDHEHVVRSRLLKRCDNLGIDEAAVAEQHRAENGGALRRAWEKRVQAGKQSATDASEALSKGRARAVDQLQQFAAAQRAGEVDVSAASR